MPWPFQTVCIFLMKWRTNRFESPGSPSGPCCSPVWEQQKKHHERLLPTGPRPLPSTCSCWQPQAWLQAAHSRVDPTIPLSPFSTSLRWDLTSQLIHLHILVSGEYRPAGKPRPSHITWLSSRIKHFVVLGLERASPTLAALRPILRGPAPSLWWAGFLWQSELGRC